MSDKKLIKPKINIMKCLLITALLMIFILLKPDLLQSQVCDNAPLQFQTCNPVIPANAFIVDRDTSILTMNGECYWVCNGVFFECAGVNSEIYVEGGSNSPLAPATDIILMSGSAENVIFFRGINNNDQLLIEPGALFNWVRRSPTLNLTDLGTDTQDNICFGVFQYDYTNAPPGGCVTTTSIDDKDFVQAKILYHTSDQTLSIYTEGKTSTVQSFVIYDLNGKVCYVEEKVKAGDHLTYKIPQNIFPGIYLVTLVIDQKPITQKLLVSK